MDKITDFLSDLPIGLIIFLIAAAFGMFGRDDKKQQPPKKAPEATRQDPFAFDEAPRQSTRRQNVFASDERRAREAAAAQREREQRDVLVFGGLDFGRSGSLFDDEGDDRDSQWGKTKYGFDDAEWGSAFSDRKNTDPIIR